ncbi:MAG: hypothetical protein WCI46_13335, partial [Verrucomicrobiota bacterium]
RGTGNHVKNLCLTPFPTLDKHAGRLRSEAAITLQRDEPSLNLTPSMKTPAPPLARLLALFAAALFHPAGNAEPPETVPSVANESPVRPTLNLKVLDSVVVKFPGHSIFYQRVAPPTAPAARAPVTAPVAKVLSLAESAAAEARANKKSEALMLSATIYDRQVTELRWRSGNRDYHVWSNINFNYLAGLGEIETEDCVYFLIMGLGNEARESVAEWNRFAPEWERLAAAEGLAGQWATKAVPDLAKFPAGRSTYLLSGDPPADDSLTALDALHRYFDANRLRLIADSAEREANRIAREQWTKEHPPTPQDTVINFWPKKSRNYPTGK